MNYQRLAQFNIIIKTVILLVMILLNCNQLTIKAKRIFLPLSKIQQTKFNFHNP